MVLMLKTLEAILRLYALVARRDKAWKNSKKPLSLCPKSSTCDLRWTVKLRDGFSKQVSNPWAKLLLCSSGVVQCVLAISSLQAGHGHESVVYATKQASRFLKLDLEHLSRLMDGVNSLLLATKYFKLLTRQKRRVSLTTDLRKRNVIRWPKTWKLSTPPANSSRTNESARKKRLVLQP